jgi:hypothetical protein
MTRPLWATVLASCDGALLAWGSLGIAMIIIFISCVKLRRVLRLGDPLGPVNWSFTDSWATTLTAVGALLGTILSSTDALPEKTELLTKGGFAGLSLFFGLLTLVAPLLFRAFARVPKIAPREPKDPPYHQGIVGVFLAATAITLWAVIGQLGTAIVLLQEVAAAAALTPSLSWLFLAFLVASLAFVALYAWRTIEATITAPTTPSYGPGTRPGWTLL